MSEPRDTSDLEAEIVKKPSELEGHAEELVDHYWGSLNHVIGLIRASEIKAGLILSFYGILFNFIYGNILMVMQKGMEFKLLYVLFGFWALVTMASIYFCIRCFLPRIEAKYDKNVFFFGDVISKYGDINAFSKIFYKISLNEKELFFQLGQQIFINSKIAALKFTYVNRAIRLLALGLFLLLFTAIYFLVISL